MSDYEAWLQQGTLTKIRYEADETGWAISMGDGTYRLANNPIRGSTGTFEPERAQWGDLVRLKPGNGDESWLEIVEKYVFPGDEGG